MAVHLGYVNVQALDVVVAIPLGHANDYRGFSRHEGPPDVVVDEEDPVLLSGAFTKAVVDRTKLLTLHAAVVHCQAGALVIPGASGLGKSTLAAALVQSGFDLMSDEMAAVDRADVTLRRFPRPITLDGRSRRLLGLAVGSTHDAQDESALVSRNIGPPRSDAAAIVLVDRINAGKPLISVAKPSDAAAALFENSFNHYRWAVSSLATIGRLAASAPVLQLTYAEAPKAARALATYFSVGERGEGLNGPAFSRAR